VGWLVQCSQLPVFHSFSFSFPCGISSTGQPCGNQIERICYIKKTPPPVRVTASKLVLKNLFDRQLSTHERNNVTSRVPVSMRSTGLHPIMFLLERPVLSPGFFPPQLTALMRVLIRFTVGFEVLFFDGLEFGFI